MQFTHDNQEALNHGGVRCPFGHASVCFPNMTAYDDAIAIPAESQASSIMEMK